MTASARTPSARSQRRTGRPTKLTPTVRENICRLIREGVPADASAVSIGIARRTFFDWLERGRAGEPLYAEFQLAVDEAHAVFHAAMVGEARADPRNAITILEKRFPKDWGRTDRHQVDVSVSQRPYLDQSKYTTEELIELRRLMVKGMPDPSDLPRDGVAASELLAASIDGVVLREEDA